MDSAPTFLPPQGASERQLRTFNSYIEVVDGCWLWRGGKTRPDWRGYAIYRIAGGKTFLLHRRLWQDHRGPLRNDQQLDHLCRNRACINLDHLEVVSPRTNNVVRGEGHAALNAKKTSCPQGHPYDDKNTRIDRQGRRHCRECERVRSREWKLRSGYAERRKSPPVV